MVAIVTGAGLGLAGTSASVLGGNGQLGTAETGRGGEAVYVNAVTGALSIQHQDELLVGRGPDLGLVRTYNSNASFDFDNNDAWQLSLYRKLAHLTGTVNTAGSTIKRYGADGAQLTYTYDAARSLYLNKDGGGAYDSLSYSSATAAWTATDGDTRISETYAAAPTAGEWRITAETDLDGNALAYTYDANGLITQVGDANGETTQLSYDAATRRLLSVQVVTGALTTTRVRYTYDASGRLATVSTDLTPADGSIADGKTYTTTYTYAGTSTRLAALVNSDGTRASFTYDASLRIASVSDGEGKVTRFTYAAGSTTVTDPLGQASTLTHDANGNLTRLQGPLGSGQDVSYTYNGHGDLTQRKDSRGHTVGYTYDANGNLLRQQDAAGNVRERAYNGANRLLRETVYAVADPDGAGAGAGQASRPQTTHYAYDANQHLRFSVSPEGRVTEVRYNALGQAVTRLVYTGGHYSGVNTTEADLAAWVGTQDKTQLQRTNTAYDARGLASTVTRYARTDSAGTGLADGSQSTTQYVYDAAGRLLQKIDPRGVATSANANDFLTAYAYDGLGRVISVTDTDAAGSAAGSGATRQTLTTFNDALNRSEVTLGNGLQRISTFDKRGLLSSVVELDGATTLATTRYTYDAAGRLRLTTDANGNKTYALYDVGGRKVGEIDPGGALSELIYNANGQMVRSVRYATKVSSSLLNALALDPASGTLTRSLLPNSLAGWRLGVDGVATDFTDGVNLNASVTLTGEPTRWLRQVGSEAISSDLASSPLAVSAGQRYEVAAYTGVQRATASLAVAFYDAAGVLLAEVPASGGAVSNAAEKPGGTTLAGYKRLWGFVTAPTGAVTARLIVRKTPTDAGQADSYLFVTHPYFAEAAATQTVASPFDLRPAAGAGDQVSRQIYDAAGRLRFTVDAHGYVAETRYDGAGRVLTTLVYAKAVNNPAALDGLGREALPADLKLLATVPTAPQIGLQLDAANDRIVRHLYDNDGLRRGTLDGEGYLTEYRYDAAGRLTQTLRYGTVTDPAQRATGTLDALLVRANAAPTENLAAYTYYNGLGQPTGELDAEGYYTAYRYDVAGNRTRTTRHANRLVGTPLAGTAPQVLAAVPATPPAGGYVLTQAKDQATQASWTAFNQLETETAIDGTLTRHAYDTLGNRLSTIAAQGTAEARTVQARYDLQGRLVQELSATGSAALAALGATPTPADIDSVWRSDGTTHAYDAGGRRVSTTDALGRKTLFYYDAAGRLTHSINALGEVSVRQYDAFGQLTLERRYVKRLAATTVSSLTGGVVSSALSTALTALASPQDSITETQYTLRGEIAKRFDATGDTTWSYNAFGQASEVSQKTDAANTRLRHLNRYDRRGLSTSKTADPEQSNVVTDDTYDAFGRLVQSRDGNRGVRTQTYDRLGRTITTTDPANVTRASAYDAFGRLLTQTDGLGNTTTTSYSDATRSTTLTTAEGISISTVRNRHGQTISVTDGRGYVTRYDYDLDGRLKLVTNPAGSTGQTYDKTGQLSETLDANNVKTTFTYDAAGRQLTRTVDPTGLKLSTEYRYDGKGQNVWIKDAEGVWTQNEYDAKGQLKATTVDPKRGPDWVSGANDNPQGLALRTEYTFDARGKTLTVTEGAGSLQPRTTQYTYDRLGRRIKEQIAPGDPKLNLTTAYTYDKNDNLVNKTDPGLHLTRYAYDRTNRLVYTVDPTGGVVKVDYDAEGRETTRTAYATPISLSGLATAPSVADVQGRVVANAVTDNIGRRVYDKDGRQVGEIDATGVLTEFVYNANGQVERTVRYANQVSASLLDALALDPSSGTLTRSLLPNSLSGWTMGVDGATTNFTNGVNLNASSTLTGEPTRWLRQAGVETISSDLASISRTVSAGKRYEVAAYTGALRATASLTVAFYDASGVKLSEVPASGGEASNAGERSGGATLAGYKRLWGFVTAPTGAVTAKLIVSKAPTHAGAADSYLFVTHAYFGAATATQTAASPFDLRPASAAADRVNRQVYDAAGRVKFTIDAAGDVTQTTYDKVGRVETTTRYANRLVGALSTGIAPAIVATPPAAGAYVLTSAADQTERFEYDNAGRLIFTVDASGAVVENRYDALGRVKETIRYAERLDFNNLVANANAAGGSIDGWTASATSAVSAIQAGLGGDDDDYAFALTNRSTYAGNWFAVSPGKQFDVSLEAIRAAAADNASPYDIRIGLAYSVDGVSAVTWLEGARSTPGTKDALQLQGRLGVPANASYAKVWVSIDGPSGATGKWYFRDAKVTQVGAASAGWTAIADPTQWVRQQLGTNPKKDQHTSYLYDHAGRLESSTDAEGKSEFYEYDDVGNKTVFKNKKGAIWRYEYDANRRLIKETSPEVTVTTIDPTKLVPTNEQASLITRIAYDANGNVTERIEGDGKDKARTTKYYYDAAGRQITTEHPRVDVYDGADNLDTNGANGATVTRKEVLGGVIPRVTVTFDALGRATVNKDVAGAYSYKVYDVLGRVQSEIDAEHYLTEYSYDRFGNVLQTKRYANALVFAFDRATAFTASEVNSLKVASPADRVLVNTYDRLNRLVSVTEPAVYSYDPDAPAGSQYFTAGRVTEKTYNAFGQVTLQRVLKNPLTNTWTETYFYYDSRGHKSAQVDALGYLTTWEYDETGDVTRQVEYAKALAAGAWSATAYGTPTATTRANSPNSAIGYDRDTRYGYDRLNRKISETRVGVETSTNSGPLDVTTVFADQTTSYGYDALGNLVRTTDALGASSYIYYDALGRKTAIAQPGRESVGLAGTLVMPPVTAQYDVATNRSQVVFAKSVGTDTVVAFEYRVAGSLADWTTLLPGDRSSGAQFVFDLPATVVSDRYDYRLTYKKPDQKPDQTIAYATGTGTFTLEGPTSVGATNVAAVVERQTWWYDQYYDDYLSTDVSGLAWSSLAGYGNGSVRIRLYTATTYQDVRLTAAEAQTGAPYWAERFEVFKVVDGVEVKVLDSQAIGASGAVSERLVLRGKTAGLTAVRIAGISNDVPVRQLGTSGVYVADLKSFNRGSYSFTPIYGSTAGLGGSFDVIAGTGTTRAGLQEAGGRLVAYNLPPATASASLEYRLVGDSGPYLSVALARNADGTYSRAYDDIANGRYDFVLSAKDGTGKAVSLAGALGGKADGTLDGTLALRRGGDSLPSVSVTADATRFQIPLEELKLDIYGNVVQQIDYAKGAVFADASTYPQLAGLDRDDKTRYFFFDSHGRVTRSVDAKGNDKFASYDVRGNVVKEWQPVRDVNGRLNNAVRTYEYDRVGRQEASIDPAYVSNRTREALEAASDHPDDSARTLTFAITPKKYIFNLVEYSAAVSWGDLGAWGDGKVKVEVFYVNTNGGTGSATVELSATAGKTSATVSWLGLGAGSVSRVQVSKQNAAGQYVLVHDRATSGSDYGQEITVRKPIMPGTQATLKYRLPGGVWKTGALTDFGNLWRFDFASLGLTAGTTYEYEVLYTRPGDDAPYGRASGTFVPSGLSVTLNANAPTGASSYVPPANDPSAYVRNEATYNAFGEINRKRIRQGATVVRDEFYHLDNAGRIWRTNDADGVVKVSLFDLDGHATAEIKSASLDLGSTAYTSPASVADLKANVIRTNTRFDALGRVVRQALPALVVNGLEIINTPVGLSPSSVSFGISSSAGWVNDGLGGYWTGTNKIGVSWGNLAAWGSGNVRLQVDYGTYTYMSGEFGYSMVAAGTTTRTVDLSAAAGNTGTTISWTDPATATYGGVSSIKRVQIWKQDAAGNWILIHNRTAAGTVGNFVTWTPPTEQDLTAQFQYKLQGSSTWTTANILKMGMQYVADTRTLGTGAYDWRLQYTRPGESSPIAHALGTLTIGASSSLTQDPNPGGAPVISQTVDRWGNVITSVDPRNSAWITRQRYNSQNQLIEQTLPQVAVTGKNGVTTNATPVLLTSYDALGRAIGSVDAEGNANTVRYDAAGQLIAEYHADKLGIVRTQYDLFGRKIRTVDGGGKATDYAYDRNDNLVKETRAEGFDTYAYDALGNRISAENALGQKTTYVYDTRGKLLESQAPGGQENVFAYDALGNRTRELNANGDSQRWAYDGFGRATAHTDLGSAAFTYAYNFNGQLLTQTNSRGQSLAYSYYENGNLKKILEVGSAALDLSVGYDATVGGNTIANTGTASGGYGEAFSNNWVTGRAYVSATPGQINGTGSFGLSSSPYDEEGNLAVDYGWALSADRSLHAFDAGGWVTVGTYAVTDVLSIAYDGTAIRYLQNGVVKRTVAAGANLPFYFAASLQHPGFKLQNVQFGTIAETAYEYDAAGNRTRETYSREMNVLQDNRISFDALGRITKVSDSRYTLTYSYDANGNRRRSQSDYLDENNVLKNVDNWYVYDAMNRITLSQGVLVNDKILIGGFSSLTPVLSTRGGTSIAGGSVTKTGTTAWGNAEATSTLSYTGSAYVSATAGQTNLSGMFGLNADPLTDQSHTSLDYAWHPTASGSLYIYESGVNVGSMGTYKTTDVLAILYEGSHIRYLRNGTVVRTVATTAGRTFYFDSSFYSTGFKLNNIRFGPPVPQGVRLAYDGAGNRRQATRWEAGAEVSETYTYDGNNRLKEIIDSEGRLTSRRLYDLAGRVTDQFSYTSTGALSEHRINSYNDNGWLTAQVIKNAAETPTQEITYTAYDNLGNVKNYEVKVNTGAAYTNYYAYTYAKFDSYKETSVSGTSTRLGFRQDHDHLRRQRQRDSGQRDLPDEQEPHLRQRPGRPRPAKNREWQDAELLLRQRQTARLERRPRCRRLRLQLHAGLGAIPQHDAGQLRRLGGGPVAWDARHRAGPLRRRATVVPDRRCQRTAERRRPARRAQPDHPEQGHQPAQRDRYVQALRARTDHRRHHADPARSATTASAEGEALWRRSDDHCCGRRDRGDDRDSGRGGSGNGRHGRRMGGRRRRDGRNGNSGSRRQLGPRSGDSDGRSGDRRGRRQHR